MWRALTMQGPLSSKIPAIATATGMIACMGSFCAELFLHSVFIEQYKNMLQAHKFGQPVQLSEDVKKLFEEVLVDLGLAEQEEKRFTPFPIAAFNLYNAGLPNKSVLFNCQGIIGIPFNYSEKNRSNFNLTEIRLGANKEPVNIYHPAAEDLMHSLLLSTNAMKFGIAREILMCQKELPFYRAIESGLMMQATLCTAAFTRVKLNLGNKPIMFQAVVYGLIGVFGFSVWFQLRDYFNVYCEKSVDEELAKLGPKYIEGGKEFYEKDIEKNIALRKLMGESGAKLYNTNGDELFFIRRKKTPLTYRKKFFSDIELWKNEQIA